MCLFAIFYRCVPGAPVLVAANREERFDRPARPPHVQPGSPRVVCGIDEQAGGTWLGVNEHGLLVAVTNRRQSILPPAPRSRGLLCRELLSCRSAAEAAQRAFAELSRGRYAGANYLCADATTAAAVHGGDRFSVVAIEPGLHLMTNADLDDPDDKRLALARRLFGPGTPATIDEFMEAGRRVCTAAGIVLAGRDRGTVSSSLVAVTAAAADAVYHHAAGPPDRTPYGDCSAALREVLAGKMHQE